jgi:protein-disulfide isomerase
MSEQSPKKGNPIAVVVIIALVFAVGAGLFIFSQKSNAPATPETPATETTETDQTAADAEVVPTKTFQLPGAVGDAAVARNQQVDLAKANQLPARVIGNKDAKLRVIEYTSLTCSHCAQFYANTLPELKKQFIDTNKIAWEKRDFPLDNTALDAAQVLRCVQDDAKSDAIREVLYRTQQKWAYEPNYRDYLKQNVSLAGMTGEQVDQCLADLDLRAKMTADVQFAANTYNIRSTPTFVLQYAGKEEPLVGAYPTKEFVEVIVNALAQAEASDAPAPGTGGDTAEVPPTASGSSPIVEEPGLPGVEGSETQVPPPPIQADGDASEEAPAAPAAEDESKTEPAPAQ